MKEWNLKLPCKLGDTVYGINIVCCAAIENAEEQKKIAQTCRERKEQCEGCEYNIPKIEEYVCTLIEIDEGGIWKRKAVILKCGSVLKKFESISKASKETGLSTSTISRYCNGLRNTKGSCEWRFL